MTEELDDRTILTKMEPAHLELVERVLCHVSREPLLVPLDADANRYVKIEWPGRVSSEEFDVVIATLHAWKPGLTMLPPQGKRLTAERRSEIARNAVAARWAKKQTEGEVTT